MDGSLGNINYQYFYSGASERQQLEQNGKEADTRQVL
jgi:hypothetical protein